jgi:NADH-quinone oxidoreductase subunit J
MIMFYVFAAVAVGASLLVIAQRNPIYSVLLLIASFGALSGLYVMLDAPFVAVIQIVVYAGAIMVLFLFVVMLLNLGRRAIEIEGALLKPAAWIGPVILGMILGAEVVYLLLGAGPAGSMNHVIEPQQVGTALYGPYLIGVELASMLLLGGLVGAYHLGREAGNEPEKRKDDAHTHHAWSDSGGDPVRAGGDRTAGSP